jgi:DNA topoisomerase-1
MPPSIKKNKNNYLLIVESPSKCKKIEEYLGPNYQCISSKGHFREIDGLGAIDMKHRFQPTYTLIPEKADHVEQMRKTIKMYPKHHILISTDDDREGEAISWHLLEVLKPKVPYKRAVFHEITKGAILDSFENPREIDMNLVQSQETRRILDRLAGYTISPVLWRYVATGLSAGRVQSCGLYLITQVRGWCDGFVLCCVSWNVNSIPENHFMLAFLEYSCHNML